MSAPIELTNVWKIFGKNSEKAFQLIKEKKLTKSEVLDQFDCVVGVANASFSVAEGEIFCIMGLSGSGKSTLIRHINRLLKPTSGEVLIHGEDILTKSDRDLRKLRATKTGMVFQNIALLPHCTVIDNVALPLEIQKYTIRQRREIALRTLEMVKLTGWENRFAHELSGGMQQRVGLARAMAADPDILLMDEPFSALDPLIRRQLQDEFLRLAEITNKTTVFITHDLDEAIRIGHRIAIMKDGVLVQIGTPEQIVTDPADAYVKDFVAGISRLKLIRAETIMEPWESWRTKNSLDADSGPRASVDDYLDRLIDVAVEHDSPILILDDNDQPVGVIDKRNLLRGIQGGSQHE